jgi:hypothetical protein
MPLPLACDLSRLTPVERRREQELLAWFRGQPRRAEETERGWRFHLEPRPDLLAALGELLALERLCCPFLEFQLEVGAAELASLHICGAAGSDVRAVIAA